MRRESFCLIFSIYLSGMCMFCPLGPIMNYSYWNSKYRCSLPHDSSFNETKQSWRSGDDKFRVHRCSADGEDCTYVCMRCKNNNQKHMGKNAAFNHMIQTSGKERNLDKIKIAKANITNKNKNHRILWSQNHKNTWKILANCLSRMWVAAARVYVL